MNDGAMELNIRGIEFSWTFFASQDCPIAEAEVSYREDSHHHPSGKLVLSKMRELEGTTWAAQLTLGDDDEINAHTVHASPLDSFNLREFIGNAMHRTVDLLQDADTQRAALQAERKDDIEHLTTVLRSLQ